MTFTKTLLAAAFALGAAVTGANAAVISNVSGNVCEGGVPPAVGAPCPSAFDLGDFDSDTTDPTLEIIGDTRIWGGVAHRNSTRDRFRDNFTLDLGTQKYQATFNWQALTTNFDGQIVVDGTSYSFTTPPSSGSIDLGMLTGDDLVVIIDPISGIFPDTPDEVGTWDLELAQVPLPAGGLLLLTALGGMGIARRMGRKKA